MRRKQRSQAEVFNAVARSHMYWGRKPLSPLMDVFGDLKPGQIVLDPFCGGGTPLIAALNKGARVIGCDLNPMAVFLSTTLIRPVNVATVLDASRCVSDSVKQEILGRYAITCRKCSAEAMIEHVVWEGAATAAVAKSARVVCEACKTDELRALSEDESRHQSHASDMCPRHWFPENRIHSNRRPPVEHHYDLFTGRNLTCLAQLLDCINHVSDEYARDALRYVFTAMLYGCSQMQQVLKNWPTSSIGWYACRFYLPKVRKEANVWRAFEKRLQSLLTARRDLNGILPHVRVTSHPDAFLSDKAEALIFQADAFKLPTRLTAMADWVFVDPPYNEHIDYLAFSEFWGSWLGMPFDLDAEWHPRRLKGEGLRRVLCELHDRTPVGCPVTLAFAPEKAMGWGEDKCISDAGYRIDWSRSAPFLYSNSVKRGEKDKRHDFYFTLVNMEHPSATSMTSKSSAAVFKRIAKLPVPLPYLYAAAYIARESNAKPGADAIITECGRILPLNLRSKLRYVPPDDMKDIRDDESSARKAYYALCGILLRTILSKDGWSLGCVGGMCVEPYEFARRLKRWDPAASIPIAPQTVFLAQKKGRQIAFFFEDQEGPELTKTLKRIEQQDKDAYRLLAVHVVKDRIERNRTDVTDHRDCSRADEFPRTFFTSFAEIREAAALIFPEQYARLCGPVEPATFSPNAGAESRSIMSFEAEVLENIPIGGENGAHYKLTFKADEMRGVRPSQFIMMDTTPVRHSVRTSSVLWKDLPRLMDFTPQPFLKRPFGIHRAFYPGFGGRYLQQLALPQMLASILHTVYPDRFDILYKVLPDGIGTPLMKRLKPGNKVHMLGPLGRPFNVRSLHGKEISEVHVIGGGVGMAPLVFLVQALRYYSFPVKVFLGIARVEALRYRDDVARTFGAQAEDAYIYIDDLLNAGVKPMNIYLSCDTSLPDQKDIVSRIPKSNLHHGLVSDRYEAYVQTECPNPHRSRTAHVLAFACGPSEMMQSVWRIAKHCDIPLKVLMEKRMACGIGVCLSCVCQTKKPDGTKDYSRVCTEGPLFDAGEIVWKNND